MTSIPSLDEWARQVLRCPICHGVLADVEESGEVVSLTCAACSLSYPVKDGIAVLLADDASSL